MGTLLNRRRVMGGGSSLPYDAEIEYLQGTGTQYIDTGFSPDINTQVNLVCCLNSYTQNGIVCGARVFGNDPGRFFPFASSDSTTARCTLGGKQFLLTVSYGTIYTIAFNDSSHRLLVNGELLGSFSGASWNKTENNNLILFGTSGYGSIHYCSKCNIYLCTIIREGTTVRDFIPVRVGQTGYMYDKVSGQLFGNSGTGDFVLGPDINN